MIAFVIFYFQAIMGVVWASRDYIEPDPMATLSTIFSPQVIISGLILAISSLAYRIIGIVYVAKNKIVTDGEKALWIVGFILMGFITSIVFLIMAKGRKFVD